jgi:hypothetical protein
MATETEKSTMTKGICEFCKSEIDKAKMTQHLKYCKQRVAANAANDADTGDETRQKEKLFHILAEGRYNPQYWMHIELPASAPLFVLDRFLRDIWVECCGHLSSFEIGGITYEDEPEDFAFGSLGASIEIIGAPEDEKQEHKEKAHEEEDEEEEEEDLSPEELAEELGNLLDAQPVGLRNMLPDELQLELRKPRSRDDLVAFLKERLAALPKRAFSFMSEDVEGERSIDFQKSTLKFLLDMVEDRSLDATLEKVLQVRQKFTYEYDFGSTTELTLKVISAREGVALEGEDDDTVFVLARNVAPVILCKECGKPATKVDSGYFNVEENAYCNKCARRSEDPEMMMPIVNSPRVGVCGYTG